ncbi:hypothetical protein FNL37_1816 [Methylovorus glucosotrophus]|uniref:hypothetical protein n=1 Tax=Methylovorus glucosotrophus TaxID=266009 RepID=UPI00133140F5|nr:hypothetical protein [Methylovorus glucosotrophus]KAF0844372.1 hypothetical protein FNL37_1816 [Methylovorus glucosotrophus]
MDDREMLEWAAKAAGLPVVFDGHLPKLKVGGGKIGAWRNWNPLEDDGDALRLAVKLNIPVSPEPANGSTWVCKGELQVFEMHGDDPSAATRRAIVRAAAAIGKEGK